MGHIEDVVIVGAGPAGAYCALELAKRGIYATIVDHSHPREKPCGGGITRTTLERFPFIKDMSSLGKRSNALKLISCTDKQVVFLESKIAFCISRRFLDEGILNLAVQHGAKLVRERVLDVYRKKTWRIKTDRENLNAKLLVGADGVNSLVRRKIIGPISRENLALCYGYIASGVENEPSTVKFLAEIPGYIWIFQRKDHSSIGIGSELKYGSMLKGLLVNFLSKNFPKVKRITSYAALLPCVQNPDFFNLPSAEKDWILVGDAAGHVDPVSGAGILYALWSGELAAKAIVKEQPEAFENFWRNAYGDYLTNLSRQRSTFYDPFWIEMSIALRKMKFFS
jgi:geranylgeranyl reductase family protein